MDTTLRQDTAETLEQNMPGGGAENPGVSLRDYVDMRFTALDHTIAVRLDALDKSIGLASAQIDVRLGGMNEWRQTVQGILNTCPTRQELQSFRDLVESQLKTLGEWKAEMKGKADQSAVNLALVIAVLSVVISVAKLFM